MSITFATFAAYGAPQLPDGTIEQISLHTWSIRKSHGPEATTVLLTDDILSDERVLKQFDIVRRRPVAKSTLLLDRARHYREFLDVHDWESHIALLDFDILVMKDLHPIFSGAADLYVTIRAWTKNMPINGGVIFLEQGRADACRRFYDDVLSSYEGMTPEHKAWYGDQLALMIAATTGAKNAGPDQIETRSGAVVGFVARNEYNFTPYDVDSGQEIPAAPPAQEIESFKDRPILHFKGPRTHLMRIVALAAGLEEKFSQTQALAP